MVTFAVWDGGVASENELLVAAATFGWVHMYSDRLGECLILRIGPQRTGLSHSEECIQHSLGFVLESFGLPNPSYLSARGC